MSEQAEPDMDLIQLAVSVEGMAQAELGEFVRSLDERGQGASEFANRLGALENQLRQLANSVEAARHRVVMCAADF